MATVRAIPTFRRPEGDELQMFKKERVPTNTKKYLGFQNTFAPVGHFWVRHTQMAADTVDKVFTEFQLKDSVTVAEIAIHPDTGRWAVMVRREWKFIPNKFVTVAAGCGYKHKAEQNDAARAVNRKLQEEAGVAEDVTAYNHDANWGEACWAYPQNVTGRQSIQVQIVKQFPAVAVNRRVFLIDLFPHPELRADAKAFALYRRDTTEHGPLRMAIQSAREFLWAELQCVDPDGNPTRDVWAALEDYRTGRL